MEKREAVRTMLRHEPPPYVPWHIGFTQEPLAMLQEHYGTGEVDEAIGNHTLMVGCPDGIMEPLGNERYRDIFGVVWNREVEKDLGVIENQLLADPSLDGLAFPDPDDPRFYADIPAALAASPDRFRLYGIGFSLFERAWSLRGMENLLTDFLDEPEFAHDLLDAIADFDVAVLRRALEHDLDGIQLGDDWGQQRGLIMGPALWREFLKPRLARIYSVAHEAGKAVFIHSCGDVDEIFDDLIEIGVNCFNPFQPEVMEVEPLMEQYHGRLAFHGGLSTQQTLPYGTPDEVRAETRRLLERGAKGGYLFAPAHGVEGDVPLENILAMIDEVQSQPGYRP